MTKIFLSYSHADEAQARRLYDDLSGHGLEVWFDRESLLPGQSWENVIQGEIEKTDYVILLLSKNSVVRRGFFQKEIRLALDVLDTIPIGHVYLIPLRLDDCEIPAPLSSIQYLDLFPHWERSLPKLYRSIEVQDEVRTRATAAEAQGAKGKSLRMLLVNDQPATMNFIVDLWKASGVSVDYAFDVPQAIAAIESSAYDVVVSDLSHVSVAGLVTDRAAFEILEWARNRGADIKMVISTSQVTRERQRAARALGAVGICNTLQELNDLIETATGFHIDYASSAGGELYMQPAGESPKKRAPDAGSVQYRVYISYSRKDSDFVRRLAGDLERNGVSVLMDANTIRAGAEWASPFEQTIREADALLVVLTPDAVNSASVKREVYTATAGEQRTSPKRVIPLLVKQVEEIPFYVSTPEPLNFMSDYDQGLRELLNIIRFLKHK